MSSNRHNYDGMPSATLNAISRDPIIFWGCSMAELQKGALLCFLIFFLPIMIVLSFIHFALGIFIGFVTWAITSRIYFSRLAKKRSDRPLFYDQHLQKKKKNVFIKPNKSYQVIKNIE